MPNYAHAKILFSNISRKPVFATILVLMYFGLMLPNSNAQQAASDESFFMFNALWFKQDGGAEKYAEYLRAAGPYVNKHGGRPNDSFVPEQALIGEFDADLMFMVEWPNFAAFTSLIQDPGYQAISHLREEAITDSLLIRVRKQ